MKKFNSFLSISVIALLLLLCPSFLDAQQNKKKPKAVSGKTKTQSKTSKKPAAVKEAAKTQNSEPTEEEMKEALINGMVERGGQRKSDGSVEINNAIAGSIVKIERFEKLGCQPATGNVGFSCTYKVTTSLTVRSNDGTAAGDRQAEAWNILLGGAGAKYTTATATKRFVRGRNGWTALDD